MSGADVLNIGTVGDWVNATKPWSSTLICPFAFDEQGHHYDSIDTKDYEHSRFAPWGSCYGKLKVRAQLRPCPRGLYHVRQILCLENTVRVHYYRLLCAVFLIAFDLLENPRLR